MDELVARAAAAHPDRVAVVTDDREVTWADLRRASLAAAASLRAAGRPRVAVVDPDAELVLAVLAGSSLVSVEVCQFPPTAGADEVRDLADRFDLDTVVTADPAALAATGLTVLASADVLAGGGEELPVPDGVRPLLVLTTGTTGVPRGVRHDWNRLVRGVRRVQPAPEQRWLLAYGLHQFAGLQVLLHVTAAGATLVAPTPRRPREGLAALRRHGATHASATPTYWRFLLAELRADGGPVPSLQQITLGGEAAPAVVLDDLRATFPDARLSHVYAASEFGSSGSVRDGRQGLSVEVLQRGDDADVAMKVVDGELWVRSRTGMLGYHGEPPVDPDAWRPTGDLVEVVGDRIVFRGRSSDVVNVGGVKVHPLPVEERVDTVPGVAISRVHGRPNPVTGAVVAVEFVVAPGHDPEDVAAAVRAACADLPPAARPRSIRPVDSLPTRGDKIVRRTA